MKIDHAALRASFESAQHGRASNHSAENRRSPSIWQFDYLVLRELRIDVEALLATVGELGDVSTARRAVDIGSFQSPYKELLTARGFTTLTLDLTREHGADLAGTAEATGLDDESVDLVICTQVLEHTRSPSACVREFHRVLRPGGAMLISVPHVWFFHPHPGDYWRLTQEGAVALCEDNNFTVDELRIQGGSLLAFGQILNFLVYGVLGPMGAPLYGVVNLVSSVADRLLPNELFSLNVAVLAHKNAASAA